MKVQGKRLTADEVQGQRVPADGRTGRLLRCLFNPLPLRVGGFTERLATTPPNLVTRLGMVRSSAHHAAGSPLGVCDPAVARDVWPVIQQAVIADKRRIPHERVTLR